MTDARKTSLFPCNAEKCEQLSSMHCPQCPGSDQRGYFCGKDCFRKSWKKHSLLHSKLPDGKDTSKKSGGSSRSCTQSLQTPTQGFSGTGKLSGAFANLVLQTVESIVYFMSFDSFEPSELPLFSCISPHHQLKLLFDVTVGLLDPLAPFPPDTAEHYSAFYAIFSYALDQVVAECDEQACAIRMDSIFNSGKSSGIMAPPVGKSDVFQAAERFANIGAASIAKEIRDRQKIQSYSKKATNDVDVDEACKTLHSSRLTVNKESFQSSLEKLKKLQDSPTSSGGKNDEEIEGVEYFWRRLFREAVIEDFTWFDHFKHTSSDIDLWYFMHGFAIGETRLYIGSQMTGLIQGPLADDPSQLRSDPLALARYRAVTDHVAKITTEFNAHWTPEAGAFVFRSFQLVSNDLDILQPDFNAKIKAAAIIEEMQDIPPPDGSDQESEDIVRLVRTVATQLWVQYWHEAMRTSGRDYASLHDRLEALRLLPPIPSTPTWAPQITAKSVGSSEYLYPSDWLAAKQKKQLQLTCSFEACAAPLGTGGLKPSMCGHCKTVFYCGRSCIWSSFFTMFENSRIHHLWVC